MPVWHTIFFPFPAHMQLFVWLGFCRKDADWHHVAVTWSFDTGKTELFFDGVPQIPTWKTFAGHWQSKAAKGGGVDPHMAPQTLRLADGQLLPCFCMFVLSPTVPFCTPSPPAHSWLNMDYMSDFCLYR